MWVFEVAVWGGEYVCQVLYGSVCGCVSGCGGVCVCACCCVGVCVCVGVGL